MGLGILEPDSCFNLGHARTYNLKEELEGRNGMTGCVLCGDECESPCLMGVF